MIPCPRTSWWRKKLLLPCHGLLTSERLVPLLCTLHDSTLLRRRPESLGMRLGRCLRPENCCAIGQRQRRYPSLQAFVNLAAPTKAKQSARATLRPLHYKTKAYDEVAPSHVLTQPGGPRGIRPIVTGPVPKECVTGPICSGFSVMTVCNPPLWEYSRDSPGARGHMRPYIETLGTQAPINTPV
jgi:hypothetical protein